MVAEYSGWPTWSTRSPSGVSSWTSSAPPSPMVSGTGAVSAATAAAWAACSGIATSLSLTGAPYFAEPAGITAGSLRATGAWRGLRTSDALRQGLTHACGGAHRPCQHTVPAGCPRVPNRQLSRARQALLPGGDLCRQGRLFAAFACSDAWVASVFWGAFTDVTDVSSFCDFSPSGPSAGAVSAFARRVYITAGAVVTSHMVTALPMTVG